MEIRFSIFHEFIHDERFARLLKTLLRFLILFNLVIAGNCKSIYVIDLDSLADLNSTWI